MNAQQKEWEKNRGSSGKNPYLPFTPSLITARDLSGAVVGSK